MDNRFANKDNTSQRSVGGRSVHTYTPRSHEDLLRSHLQLDSARKARLQNEVQRLAGENDRLRRELDRARQELRDKDTQIEVLNNELQTRSQRPPASLTSSRGEEKPTPTFEVNGKQVTFEELHQHFNIVIQRHHDLLNRKNQEIQQQRDQLMNQPKERSVTRRDIHTQSSRPFNDDLQQNLMNDFSQQLALVRKEYQQVEFILQDRNNKLEHLIRDLERKLDEYAIEINNLRKELAEREGNQKPSESMMILIQEKEKENNYLKEIISTLKTQPNNVIAQGTPQATNEDLNREIRNIIDGKSETIHKLNNMINNVKNDRGEVPAKTPDIEKDCEKMISDINEINNKLNDVLNKLKDSPSDVGQSLDKNNLISDLEAVKKQCQEEIDILKNQVGESSPDSIILRGQAVVRIDDPNYFKKKPDCEMVSLDPIEAPSSIKFVLYNQTPQALDKITFKPYDKVTTKPGTRAEFRDEMPKTFYTGPSTSSTYRHYPLVPCEACSETHIPDKSVPRPLPSTPPPIRRGPSPTPTKPQDSGRYLIHELHGPSIRSKSKEGKKKKGKGCCAKQSSDTSSIPYSRQAVEEKVLNTYSPYQTHENRKNLYPALKNDDFSYEFPTHASSVRSRSPQQKNLKPRN